MLTEDGWPENLLLLAFATAPLVLFYGLRRFFAAQRKRPQVGIGRLVAGNLGVLLFLCSLGLLAGELWCRFGLDMTMSFNSEKISRRWFDRHWVKNGTGLRDDVEYLIWPPIGKRRVVFLGDSFTAGQGIEVEERFANRFRAGRKDLDVHVVAGLGWDTSNQMRTLKNLIDTGHSIDVVVLCYCLNDSADLAEGMDELLKFVVECDPPPPVVRHSYFLDWLYWRLVFTRHAVEPEFLRMLGETYRDPDWERQKRRLTDLQRLVESGGGKLVVVTFPLMSYGPNYEFREAHAQLDRLWTELGVPHLDLLEAFEEHPPSSMVVNRWDSHPNALANAIAAEAIDRFWTSADSRKSESP